jgi:hypothetical protein
VGAFVKGDVVILYRAGMINAAKIQEVLAKLVQILSA